MITSRFVSSLVVALVLTGCGSDDSHKAAPPPAPAAKPVPPPAPPAAAAKPAAQADGAAVCAGKWTSGPTGTLTCSGPGNNTTFNKAAFRLDRVCVNDPRVSAYAAGGKTVTMTLTPDGKRHCATFAGVAEVPESCSCVAPAGGDCNAPEGGFVCIAIGHTASAGG